MADTGRIVSPLTLSRYLMFSLSALRRAGDVFHAIDKSHDVIEFDMVGCILRADQIFLDQMGYQAAEVNGKQNCVFMDPVQAEGQDYRHFWYDLRSGKAQSGSFLRLSKGGRQI